MVLPIQPIVGSHVLSKEASELILQYELTVMDTELPALEKYRSYYDGDQAMVYGTEKFLTEFGPVFKGFKDNWSAPVVEALADKMYAKGLRLGTTDAEIESNTDLARDIWNVFRANDIDEQQADLWEGAFVEGRSYMICWPEEDPDAPADVRIDWNPADLMRVRYADDDPRKIVWAMKRWLTPSGDIYITVYTTTAIYKYVEPARELLTDTRTGKNAERPTVSPTRTFTPRLVPGESWPLPNPYGLVPVVEFLNKRESELHDVIPLQDAVNYLMLQGLSAAGFQGFPQRGFMSGVKEPVGGWSNQPGRVWQVPPDIDPEGNLHYGSHFEFQASDMTGVKNWVDMVLQHLALQTKTPVRMFFQSDRGGRGDAPSGESLLVEDQPLLDKVEDRQRRFGNSLFRAVRMVAAMSESINSQTLPLGEIEWKDPRSKYRSALMAEGALMVDKMGMPIKFVATQLGFSQDEVELLTRYLDEQKAEAEEQAQREIDGQIEVANARPQPAMNPNGGGNNQPARAPTE